MHTINRQITCLTSAILLNILLLFSSASFGQKPSMKQQKVPLEKAIKMLCDKAGYNYLFDGKVVQASSVVDIAVNTASLEEAISKTMNGLPLTFSIRKKLVVIKPAAPAVWVASNSKLVNITGMICDENKKALSGAVIRLKNNSSMGTTTGDNGFFVMNSIPVKTTLVITYTGYKPEEVVVTGKPFIKQMSLKIESLMEVGVISNGYQYVPKNRATGSFTLVDTTLFNRKVSTNVLERIEGVTSGVLFNKNTPGNTPFISIRDRSTIFANTNPLIILDNFPYDGDISNINPQDIASTTILKDAAAASIWGSRAGNGVIVFTTKQGKFDQSTVISFNSNVTYGNISNQYYKAQLTNTEYIDVEQFLFDKGKYNSKINSGYASISPAVEVMLLSRKNLITASRKKAMLDSIAGHDNRTDLEKYFYRKSINQQYQMSVAGGGIYNKYYISLGYDNNRANEVTSSYDRFTLDINNTTSFLKNKAQFNTGLLFSSGNSKIKGSDYVPIYPYENVADANGNPLAVTDGTLRLPYVDTAGNGKLLDWHYRPLDELKQRYHTFNSTLTDYRISIGMNYKIIQNLKFSINYTYDKSINEFNENHSSDSYYTRNLINSFTQIDNSTGSVILPVPFGDIVDNGKNSYYSHYGRGQLSYENEFSKQNAISLIAGYEFKDYQNSKSFLTLYGYDRPTASNLNASVNPVKYYPYYYSPNTSRIPLIISNAQTIDRYISYFANGSYIYNQKYVLSASLRRDESNLFGIKSNQKGVPLWSAGLAWNLSKEDFYHSTNLPNLKLRATFGYNGNVDKTTSAYLTTQSVNGGNDWGQPVLQVNNPPNPSLTWEKVRNTNFAADFGTKENRLSGSVEYWIKDGIDLIGQSLIAPQTGISIFKGNSAHTRSKGIDLTLNTVNIDQTTFKWSTMFLFNYNTDKIISYKSKKGTNGEIVKANYLNPLEGYSYYSLFSYKWKGLDNTGSPQGLLNGVTSKEYSNISGSDNTSELIYNGTLRPKYFGLLMNSFNYKSWQLSVNIIYKFDYFFRRQSLNNFTLYQDSGSALSYQQPDYALRWQKPGDEFTTNVPALIYPAKSVRDDFYSYTNILVEKADHVRLQDIRIDYQFNKEKLKHLPISRIDFYVYAANFGILWKATDQKIDPDYLTGPPQPFTTAIGVKAYF